MSKERPILFSAPMVRAILDGSKTQTRRICKARTQSAADIIAYALMEDMVMADDGSHEKAAWELIGNPFGKRGDRLWVKETWRTEDFLDALRPRDLTEGQSIKYECDDEATGIVAFGWGRVRQSIFMRRWMSRITLEIVSVSVERLNFINEQDCIAEGVSAYVENDRSFTAKEAYSLLWESINGPGSWDANPWVWVVEFKRVERTQP